MSPFVRKRILVMVFGVFLIAGGLAILGPPLVERLTSIHQTNQRGQADNQALSAWVQNGTSALNGAAGDAGKSTAATCGDSNAFALVQFTGVTDQRYAGVAGDGTWDMLHQRSMVHYTGTPGPGEQGNSIIAFHREPNYEHIDELNTGGTVTIEDHTCHTFVYTVTQRWDLSPGAVTQLVPTTGHDLTLITCTPWWQDYNRFVWRATLTSVDGKPFTA